MNFADHVPPRAEGTISFESICDEMARIYISSTYQDLVEERRAVRDAVVRLDHLPVAMETYTATGRRPVDQCLADVALCQVYVGIFAWRYGYVPSSQGKSITYLEYKEAGRCGIRSTAGHGACSLPIAADH